MVNPSAPANVMLSNVPSLAVSLSVALEPAAASEEMLYVGLSLLIVISLLDLIIDNPVPAVRTMSLVTPCESLSLIIFLASLNAGVPPVV